MEANTIPHSSQLPQGQVFTLDALETMPQTKSAPPRIKVDKNYELSQEEGVKWFVDTYDANENYKGDLHLYISRGDMAYGDMGIVVAVKDDVDSRASPCFSCNVLPEGETTKANRFLLSLDTLHLFDMTGSKLGKQNSIVNLGLKVVSFNEQEESGVESVEDFVKAVRQAKRALGLQKKLSPEKRRTTITSKKVTERRGRAIVQRALLASKDTSGSTTQPVESADTLMVPTQVAKSQDGKKSSRQTAMQNQTKKRTMIETSTPKAPRKEAKKQKQGVTIVDIVDEVLEGDELMDIEPVVEANVEVGIKDTEKQAEGNRAMEALEVKQSYYPFGVSTSFNIDVMQCFPAPSNYVYRRLNKDWVKILTHDFIEDTKQEEILAILMPVDPDLKKPLTKLAKEDINKVKYWIVSGQHSISAAKRLQNAENKKVTPLLRRQFRFRKSKIILNCPPKTTREISKDANISIAKSMQKEPFLDQLMQARSQWIANGRPNKPPPGVNLSKSDYNAWKVQIFVMFVSYVCSISIL